MQIERNQSLGKAAAIERIDTFLDNLMRREMPGGVAIQDASKVWTDNVMKFSFVAKKFFVSAPISGTVTVNDDSVVLNSELPSLVTSLISEDKIRNMIGSELDKVLAA
jgi:hypothetical protein